jgi:hypothetical protein
MGFKKKDEVRKEGSRILKKHVSNTKTFLSNKKNKIDIQNAK